MARLTPSPARLYYPHLRTGRIRSAERVEAHLPVRYLCEPSFSPPCGHRAPHGKKVAMSSTPQGSPRRLPEHPDLRHLKDQAKDLLRVGQAASLAGAQFQVARQYGFASWPKLKAHVESVQTVGQLKQAIDSNDLE